MLARLGHLLYWLGCGLAAVAFGIHAAFVTLRQRRADALVVGGDPFFTARRQQIVTLAIRDAIPAIYPNREFATEGGLMSYGNDVADGYRRAALHVARILKGEKPSELPVDQAVKFEFVINLTAAKALGLTVPPTLLARADEVIEQSWLLHSHLLHLLTAGYGTTRTSRSPLDMSARGPTAATSIENDSYRPQGPRVRVLAQSNPSKRRRRFINLHIDGIDLIEHVRLFVLLSRRPRWEEP
jgi:ABC transporter substrate binding protein